jgi:signal transduction histidine kinase
MKKDLLITERMKLEAQVFEQLRKDVLSVTEMALEEQEKQRNLIGQELHDNINQILAATLLQLSMIKNSHNQTEELAALAMNNLHQAINEIRKLAHVLVAPDFETHSLVDQITTLTDTMLKASGIMVYIHATGLAEKLLEDKQKLAIYRIAQEQCINIIKHAKAQVVNIFLNTTAIAFKMIISDDGKGMEASKHAEGIGLRNIKARLSIFNGVVNIITPPYKGFTLEITIPFK